MTAYDREFAADAASLDQVQPVTAAAPGQAGHGLEFVRADIHDGLIEAVLRNADGDLNGFDGNARAGGGALRPLVWRLNASLLSTEAHLAAQDARPAWLESLLEEWETDAASADDRADEPAGTYAQSRAELRTEAEAIRERAEQLREAANEHPAQPTPELGRGAVLACGTALWVEAESTATIPSGWTNWRPPAGLWSGPRPTRPAAWFVRITPMQVRATSKTANGQQPAPERATADHIIRDILESLRRRTACPWRVPSCLVSLQELRACRRLRIGRVFGLKDVKPKPTPEPLDLRRAP